MRVAVVGLGVIGGSLARVLRARGHEVVGVDRPDVLRRARAARAVSRTASSLADAARDADVMVLAAPPRANLTLLREAARVAEALPALVVTDVGSVKAEVVKEAQRLGLRRFVGGHPIAGNEGSGFAASRVGLFEGRAWVLSAESEPAALRRVRALAKAAGARPVVMEAARHDRALAFLSHVPQITAWALFEAARRDPVAGRALSLAGPGFADMTRLAKSPRGLWREILGQNRREVERALRALRAAFRREAP